MTDCKRVLSNAFGTSANVIGKTVLSGRVKRTHSAGLRNVDERKMPRRVLTRSNAMLCCMYVAGKTTDITDRTTRKRLVLHEANSPSVYPKSRRQKNRRRIVRVSFRNTVERIIRNGLFVQHESNRKPYDVIIKKLLSVFLNAEPRSRFRINVSIETRFFLFFFTVILATGFANSLCLLED